MEERITKTAQAQFDAVTKNIESSNQAMEQVRAYAALPLADDPAGTLVTGTARRGHSSGMNAQRAQHGSTLSPRGSALVCSYATFLSSYVHGRLCCACMHTGERLPQGCSG